MNKRPRKITSQQELDELIRKVRKGSPLDCFVLLNFGIRSSKQISLNENGDYYVYNECDDSEEVINHSSFTSSFLGEALSKGALYKY